MRVLQLPGGSWQVRWPLYSPTLGFSRLSHDPHNSRDSEYRNIRFELQREKQLFFCFDRSVFEVLSIFARFMRINSKRTRHRRFLPSIRKCLLSNRATPLTESNATEILGSNNRPLPLQSPRELLPKKPPQITGISLPEFRPLSKSRTFANLFATRHQRAKFVR